MGGRPKLPDISLDEAARIYTTTEAEFLRHQSRQAASRYRKSKWVPLDAVAVKLLAWWREQRKMIAAARADERRIVVAEYREAQAKMLDEVESRPPKTGSAAQPG